MIGTCKAPAKINLFLHVVGKNDDGYHLLESLFSFTSIVDLIQIRKAEALSVQFLGAEIDHIDNTVYKAVKLLAQHSNNEPNLSIIVNKNIPLAAGVGGGSADAAAILKFLCNIWSIKITQEIYYIALKVGADVPACLNQQACFVTGIGEKISNISNFPALDAVLVNPEFEVNTKDVFASFGRDYTESMADLFQQRVDILQMIQNTKNDLQEVTEGLYPKIKELVSIIESQDGCINAKMSGSGPTCFGLFSDTEKAKQAVLSLRKSFKWVEYTKLY